MKTKFGQNLSQIGALNDFYGQKNLGRQSSGIELSQEANSMHSPAYKVDLLELSYVRSNFRLGYSQ